MSRWTRTMPARGFGVRCAPGSLIRRAAGPVSARRRRKGSSADVGPCGIPSRRAAAVRAASINGGGPAVYGAAAGRCMKTGTKSSASNAGNSRCDGATRAIAHPPGTGLHAIWISVMRSSSARSMCSFALPDRSERRREGSDAWSGVSPRVAWCSPRDAWCSPREVRRSPDAARSSPRVTRPSPRKSQCLDAVDWRVSRVFCANRS